MDRTPRMGCQSSSQRTLLPKVVASKVVQRVVVVMAPANLLFSTSVLPLFLGKSSTHLSHEGSLSQYGLTLKRHNIHTQGH